MSEALQVNSASDASIQQLLRERFAAPDYRPPMLPAAAVEVLRLSQQPKAGIDDIVLVLERDTLLAGRVLKLAQSAFYAGKSPARTLVQASVRLGLSNLRNLVLESAFHGKVVRGTPFDGALADAQAHSLAVAYLTRMVARNLNIDADYAFLLGLMHEIGLVSSLTVLSEQRNQKLTPDVVAAISAMHTEAGELVTKLWQLPPSLVADIGSHHNQPRSAGNAVLAIAEHICDQLGFGLNSYDVENKSARLEGAMRAFSIDAKWIEKLGVEGKKIVELAIPG